MEVGKINKNYLLSKTANSNVKTAQSFTGGAVMSELEYIKKLCGNPKMAKFALENKWLERLQGELGGIVVTAVGTGLVAPFPIAYNPFVKANPNATEEEKAEVRRTKQYSAWRQPISAAIAIFFQAGVQPFINRFLDYLTNDPESAKKWWVFLDQSAINKASYLERNIKAEMKQQIKAKDLNIKEVAYKQLYLKPKYEKEIDEEVRKGAIRLNDDEIKKELKKRINTHFEQEKAEGVLDQKLNAINDKEVKKGFSIELRERVKERQSKQIKEMAKTLRDKGSIIINERVIDPETMANLFNKKVDAYISEAEKLKVFRHSKGEFKGRDFYLTRAEDLIDNEAELRRILDASKLPPLVKDPSKADIEKLQKYLKDEIAKTDNDAIKEILQEILDKDDPVVRRSRCTRTLDRIDCIKDLCGKDKGFSLSEYSNAIKNQNAIIDEKIKEFKSLKLDPKDASPQKLQEAMAQLIEKCQYDGRNPLLKKLLGEDGKVFGTVKKDLEKRVYKDIVEAYQALVKARFTGVSQALKVLIGVCVTLPISCSALNWVYPRFMDLFFPGLAGTKKDVKEGGAK